MIFQFFDKTQAITDEETGKRLTSMIDSGAEWVEINGDRYSVKAIAAIKKGGIDPANSPKRIEEGEKRRASIETVQRIKNELEAKGIYKK